MPQLVEDGDRRLIVAGGLRLVFEWSGDRWLHSLEARIHDGSYQVIAKALNLSAERDEPSRVFSPTFQDLQFQEHGSGLQALLVGQAGPHHFSAVFSVENDRKPDYDSYDLLIRIDIADRCRSQVEALASTYVLSADTAELFDAGPNIAAWRCGLGLLCLHPIAPARVTRAEAGRLASQFQIFTTPEAVSSTHRLIYHWLWRDNSAPSR
jgi:hypothetical protein